MADSCPLSEQIRSLGLKITDVLFIVFDNFFKVTLVYACFLIWNMNAISRISIKNSFTFPKQSQIHFLMETLIRKYLHYYSSSRSLSMVSKVACKSCNLNFVHCWCWELRWHRNCRADSCPDPQCNMNFVADRFLVDQFHFE